MSPSYVVWYTPHSRLIIWLSPSDPLDDLAPEEPVRPAHQSEDHEDVGQKALGAPAHVGIDVARGHALDRPADEASDQGARDAVQTTEDDGREALEAPQSELRAHAARVPPEDAT